MTWKELESNALQLAVPAALPTKVMVQKACEKAAQNTVKVSGNRCVMFRLTCGSFVSESNRKFLSTFLKVDSCIKLGSFISVCVFHLALLVRSLWKESETIKHLLL